MSTYQLCTINNLECMGPVDEDHITTRGSGARNTVFYAEKELCNIMPLCRNHHQIKHSQGVSHMIKTYPKYKYWLEEHGRCDIFEKLTLRGFL